MFKSVKAGLSMLKKRDIRKLIRKLSWTLLPVIVTILLTQAYYAHNVRYQVRIEAEKDLYINQIETYNALQMIKTISKLHSFQYKTYFGQKKIRIYVDIFGNYMKQDIKNDSNSITLVDSTYNVPVFVCNTDVGENFYRYITILRSNCMRLDPKASIKCNEFIAFVNAHPIPACDSITPRSVIESGWTSTEYQRQYYSLLNELYDILKLKVDKFN